MSWARSATLRVVAGSAASSALISSSSAATVAEALVPSLLQFAGDETVVGIDGIVLATRTGGLVARLLEASSTCRRLSSGLARASSACECRLDAERLQALDHLGADRRSIRMPPNEMQRSPP